MNHLEADSTLDFITPVFSNSNCLIGVVRDAKTKVFVRILKNKDTEEINNFFWYTSNSVDPEDIQEVHFVDVLEIVGEEAANKIIFNMDLFLSKKG